MSGRGDIYTGYYTLAVEGLHEGKGAGDAPWNPERIVNCLRQLEKWTRRALSNRKTRLQCFAGHGLQRVADAFPNRTCKLKCGCIRSIHTLSDERYRELVERSQGLKIKGRNARVGGYGRLEEEMGGQ
jgi:hypothetical protein